ncbi:MAG: ribulose 1,5-bisphosphate carboxylase [Actinobacteria bacterium]|nr:ribulose 1,5-bisphosphate carboxylase [Actinomycetota bacterium]MBU1942562.1 ribulose 1,5-bisphosphate carboxylase [Actinomycetota bacterium]MBU2687283.1 ribulose 1,5-bisphosphate carboxylase [Actinomycetota bacterium]
MPPAKKTARKAAAKKAAPVGKYGTKLQTTSRAEESCVLGKYDADPYALPEGIDFETHVIATYYVEFPKQLDVVTLAPVIAIEQSTGTWTPVPGETPEVRARHIAKVVNVFEAPDYEYVVPDEVKDRQWIVQVAFPAANIENQIPMLLTACLGNISMAGRLKLLDLRMPKAILDGYQGPKFGSDGIYKALGIPKSKRRPLLNNMIKPCCGYPVKVGADLFYQAAVGGCDIIKDDELIADMSYNRVLERVKAYMKMEKRAYEETGEHTLYTVNVTDRLPKMFDLARAAVEAGGNALMVNYLAIGPEAMRTLAEDPDINVPILAHMDCAGAYFMSPHHGVASSIILGKLPRLAGADTVVIPFAMGGKAPYLPERFKQVVQALTYPFGKLKAMMPMPSGGITPVNVQDIVNVLGNEVMIGSGGGVHAHPEGPIAGGKAFRQAITAALKGIPVQEYGAEHRELGMALGIWGVKTEFKV